MPIITVEKAEHLCSMLRAMAAGKTVQCRLADGSWVDKHVAGVSSDREYRIKPEPVLLHYRNYFARYPVRTGNICNVFSASFRSDSIHETKANVESNTTRLNLGFSEWIGDWQSIELKE